MNFVQYTANFFYISFCFEQFLIFFPSDLRTYSKKFTKLDGNPSLRLLEFGELSPIFKMHSNDSSVLKTVALIYSFELIFLFFHPFFLPLLIIISYIYKYISSWVCDSTRAFSNGSSYGFANTWVPFVRSRICWVCLRSCAFMWARIPVIPSLTAQYY